MNTLHYIKKWAAPLEVLLLSLLIYAAGPFAPVPNNWLAASLAEAGAGDQFKFTHPVWIFFVHAFSAVFKDPVLALTVFNCLVAALTIAIARRWIRFVLTEGLPFYRLNTNTGYESFIFSLLYFFYSTTSYSCWAATPNLLLMLIISINFYISSDWQQNLKKRCLVSMFLSGLAMGENPGSLIFALYFASSWLFKYGIISICNLRHLSDSTLNHYFASFPSRYDRTHVRVGWKSGLECFGFLLAASLLFCLGLMPSVALIFNSISQGAAYDQVCRDIALESMSLLPISSWSMVILTICILPFFFIPKLSRLSRPVAHPASQNYETRSRYVTSSALRMVSASMYSLFLVVLIMISASSDRFSPFRGMHPVHNILMQFLCCAWLTIYIIYIIDCFNGYAAGRRNVRDDCPEAMKVRARRVYPVVMIVLIVASASMQIDRQKCYSALRAEWALAQVSVETLPSDTILLSDGGIDAILNTYASAIKTNRVVIYDLSRIFEDRYRAYRADKSIHPWQKTFFQKNPSNQLQHISSSLGLGETNCIAIIGKKDVFTSLKIRSSAYCVIGMSYITHKVAEGFSLVQLKNLNDIAWQRLEPVLTEGRKRNLSRIINDSGVYYLLKGDRLAALSCFRRSASIDPDNIPALINCVNITAESTNDVVKLRRALDSNLHLIMKNRAEISENKIGL